MDKRLVIIVAFATLLMSSCTREISGGAASGAPQTLAPVSSGLPAPTTVASVAPPPPPEDPNVRYDYRSAPQLGTEPVRGSGCGLDGSLGGELPDGWWYGIPSEWQADSFSFDVVCVYVGPAARPLIEECLAGPDPDPCSDSGSEDFWVANNDEQLRTVPISADLEIVNPDAAACPEYDVREAAYYTLIHIVDGQAIYLATSCPGG